jgi:hypothetical protein
LSISATGERFLPPVLSLFCRNAAPAGFRLLISLILQNSVNFSKIRRGKHILQEIEIKGPIRALNLNNTKYIYEKRPEDLFL